MISTATRAKTPTGHSFRYVHLSSSETHACMHFLSCRPKRLRAVKRHARADERPPPQVMTYASPPFVFVHDDGDGDIQFSGLAMDLLSQLAVNVGFCYNVTYTRGVCQLGRILLEYVQPLGLHRLKFISRKPIHLHASPPPRPLLFTTTLH
jgi:hypothetical protein